MSQDRIRLGLTNEAKLPLLVAVEALDTLQVLRSLPNQHLFSAEMGVLLNRLGKIFIYLRWLLVEKVLKTNEISRETLLTIIEVEGKIVDLVTDVEGYGN